MVPKRLLKWQDIIDANVDEIKSEYIFISKKSVVDFVLGKSLDNSCGNHSVFGSGGGDGGGFGDGNGGSDAKISRERNEIKDIGKQHAHM